MTRKFLSILALWLPLQMVAPQSYFSCEGTIVGRDINVRGQMPESLRAILDGRRLEDCTSHLTSLQRPKAQRIKRSAKRAVARKIGPLLQTVTGQEAPFNLLCPYYTSASGWQSEERCLAGCVATSIEQIMAYYRYPDALTDTLHGWSTPNYVIEDLLPGTRFDWDNHLLDYRAGWISASGC